VDLILLIRHASAGDREQWTGDDDRRRPLDARGRRQADALVELLAEYDVDLVVSSPADRCIQTVEPLAAARGLVVEAREELSEERQDSEGAAFVRALAGSPAISCHGGLSWGVAGESQKKAEVIVLERHAGSLRPVERLRPSV
jgi:8-oxo-dGTP diphosphatase